MTVSRGTPGIVGSDAMLVPDRSPPCLLPAAGLPLTAFEEFMFRDDRPSHPMAIVARFDFAGGPPPRALATTFTAALRHEPLLTARIVAPRGGRPRWLSGPCPTLDVAAAENAPVGQAAMVPAMPRLDPLTGPVLQARVIPGDDAWSLVVAVHHAACDGLGLIGFVERWLRLATDGVNDQGPDTADRREALDGRGRVAGSWREFFRLLPKLSTGLAGVRQFIGREVAALGEGVPDGGRPHRDATSPPPWRPAVVTTALDAGLVGRLDDRARRQGVTVNDLLMAALMTTLGDHGALAARPAGGERWIRLATPMSLRTAADDHLPAVNRVSMVFLDRRPSDLRDEARLLAGLREEMDLIRSHHLGHILPLSLEAGRWCPGGLARTARRPQPQSTAVLSNLKRCFQDSPLADADGAVRVGSSRLTGWWFVPPVRPGTALAAGTHETCGRRTIAFHVDESRVRLEVARGWLNRMEETLRALADTAPGRPTLLAAAVP
ncbi:MAG: hypothetical protein ACKOSQ_08425 [Planctomycetaceae bacterium]